MPGVPRATSGYTGHRRLSCRGDSAVTGGACDFYQLLAWSPSAATMSGRNNNKLPSNLPQLQNLIKRDPPAYIEEVGRGSGSLGSSRRFLGPSGGERGVGRERSRGLVSHRLQTCRPADPTATETLFKTCCLRVYVAAPPRSRGPKRLRPRHSTLVPEI